MSAPATSSPNDPELPIWLHDAPPPVADTIVSFPAPHILLVTLNRPEALNAIPRPQHFALERLWGWYDDQPPLRCAIITGAGRAFSAGADLKEWRDINSAWGPAAQQSGGTSAVTSRSEETSDGGNQPGQNKPDVRLPRGGFGGMANRGGKKPILAAVNGLCYGGGFEMAINCDMVIAAMSAKFSLPEVTVGVIAITGGLLRLTRSVGRQRAMEMALCGKSYTAEQMEAWGLVNEVVPDGGDGPTVLEKALEWARCIAGNSPDAVIVSRESLKLSWEGVGPEEATDVILNGWYKRVDLGMNMIEGVNSFLEKRKPVWKDTEL
ncbi:hypothetical protein JX266_011052 [Neoarthrinium moseri]|nr:hypothetical protein JX266_011052 [Neoarthrinium moseri]